MEIKDNKKKTPDGWFIKRSARYFGFPKCPPEISNYLFIYFSLFCWVSNHSAFGKGWTYRRAAAIRDGFLIIVRDFVTIFDISHN